MSETQSDYNPTITGLEEVFEQPPVSLHDAICVLAKLRLTQAQAKEHLTQMRKALEETPEYLLWYETLRIAETDATLLEAAMKKTAVDGYGYSGEKHPHPAINVRMNTRMVYNPESAMAWCRANLPQALKLDSAFFEKHAKAVSATMPLDFVAVVCEPAATIVSDLSHYLIDGAK